MAKATEEQIKKYIRTGALHCPVCGSLDIYNSGVCSADVNRAYWEIICRKCSATWTDGFTLDSVGTGEGEDYEFIYPELPNFEPPPAEATPPECDTCIGYPGCHGQRTKATLQELRKRIQAPSDEAIALARAIRNFMKDDRRSIDDLARFLEAAARAEV